MPRPNMRALVEQHLDGKTAPQVAAAAGVSVSTANLWIRALRAEGKCHIGGWVRNLTMSVAVYRMGPGKDKPCKLKPMTGKEYSQRFRDKLRREDKWDTYLARQRAKRTVEQARAGRFNDPIINALHGRT